MIFFLMSLIIAVLALIFALSNATPIDVSFFSWKFTGSVALLLLSAFIAGVIATLIALVPSFIKNSFIGKKKSKIIDEKPIKPIESSDVEGSQKINLN